MPQEYKLGALSEIPRGEGRNFDLGGKTVAVFRNHDDEVFATQAKCPHRAGPLADGLVGGRTLICPLHELAFDLSSGAGVGQAACLAVYPARLGADQTIWLTI